MNDREKIADLTERVIEALRCVYDPEIPVNIFDLGLIYTIDVGNIQAEKSDLLIEMTLTTANCPMADMIPGMVYDAVTSRIPDFNQVDVKLVWEPAWDPSRMSEEARFELDML
jgi:FeS assembly SUF system protein